MLQLLARDSGKKTRSQVVSSDTIPNIFCWTKMGTEAGQSLSGILQRKELERRSGGGTFAWGIGNSLGNSAALAKRVSPSGEVDVLFTPMKSSAKAIDVSPARLLLWLFYKDPSGMPILLPEHMLVTSRGDNDKRTHYALLCKSERQIEDGSQYGAFDSTAVTNLATRNPVGASQVTSVVNYEPGMVRSDRPYRISFKAKLHAEGFVRLTAPISMSSELMSRYREVCSMTTVEDWRAGVRALRNAAIESKRKLDQQKEFAFLRTDIDEFSDCIA